MTYQAELKKLREQLGFNSQTFLGWLRAQVQKKEEEPVETTDIPLPSASDYQFGISSLNMGEEPFHVCLFARTNDQEDWATVLLHGEEINAYSQDLFEEFLKVTFDWTGQEKKMRRVLFALKDACKYHSEFGGVTNIIGYNNYYRNVKKHNVSKKVTVKPTFPNLEELDANGLQTQIDKGFRHWETLFFNQGNNGKDAFSNATLYMAKLRSLHSDKQAEERSTQMLKELDAKGNVVEEPQPQTLVEAFFQPKEEVHPFMELIESNTLLMQEMKFNVKHFLWCLKKAAGEELNTTLLEEAVCGVWKMFVANKELFKTAKKVGAFFLTSIKLENKSMSSKDVEEWATITNCHQFLEKQPQSKYGYVMGRIYYRVSLFFSLFFTGTHKSYGKRDEAIVRYI